MQMQDSGLPQPQQGTQPTGLLDRLGQTVNTPLTFDDAPPIRDNPIIQPSTNPVDVPGAREATGRLQATAPVGFSGPDQMRYGGQRVGPGQMIGGPQQYGQVAGPGQYGQVGGPGQSQQFRQQAGPGVDPSQTPAVRPQFRALFRSAKS